MDVFENVGLMCVSVGVRVFFGRGGLNAFV